MIHPTMLSAFSDELQKIVKEAMSGATLSALKSLPGISKAKVTSSFLKQMPKKPPPIPGMKPKVGPPPIPQSSAHVPDVWTSAPAL